MRLGRFEISEGALLAGALIYYCDREGAVPWLLLAAGLHELGHWAAIRLLGGGVSRLRISLTGAQLDLSAPLSPGRMLVAALAGPGANLLTAALALWGAGRGFGPGLYFFAALSLGLALFNLIPAQGLDGGWVLRSIRELLGIKDGCSHIPWDLICALPLLVVGGLAAWESGGRNLTLLWAGAWLLIKNSGTPLAIFTRILYNRDRTHRRRKG